MNSKVPTSSFIQHHLVACQVMEIIETEFDIGFVTNIEQLYGGYTNLSFSVSTFKAGRTHKIFFRKYWKGVTAEIIEFEHALLGHVISRGAHIVAGVIRTREGQGYVRRFEQVDGKEQESYFAAFEFIEGFDKYSWLQNDVSDEESASAGAVLADLHNAAADFSVNGLKIPRASVLHVIPQMRGLLLNCIGRRADSRCHHYLQRNLPLLLDVVDRTMATLARLPQLPTIGIHGDFHPGNQKYFASRVVGVFDFDRASIDLRVFDVALAVIYFCCAWDGKRDGEIRLDKLAIFLDAYQRRSMEVGPLGSMDAKERDCFPLMLAAANLVLVKWSTIDTFFVENSACDDGEYLAYLQHHIRLMRWLEGHQEKITRTIIR